MAGDEDDDESWQMKMRRLGGDEDDDESQQ